MKKKFIIFTLCFTLIFSSLNYKKSYADGGVISLPVLATVSALAVGTGIIINSNDDLYGLGRVFYDYIDKHNDLTWATVQTAFASSVSLLPNKLVSVKSEFLDIVKGFFDNTFNDNYINNSLYTGFVDVQGRDYSVGRIKLEKAGSSYHWLVVDGNSITSDAFIKYVRFQPLSSNVVRMSWYQTNDLVNLRSRDITLSSPHSYFSTDFLYEGGYSWDNVEDKKENVGVSLPIPENLGQLVGQGSTDFWDNTDNLVGGGEISIPSVDSPSIGLGGDLSFPSVSVPDVPSVDSPSVPSEGIWATIKDFIINLVVPSDTYWTDTWGGLYNNFTNSFPMVDMDGFNDLVTGEKKFPNIDINIMGVSGRVVNGDVINSIVDWLRPIIAGFMMLCLMLFNYRKIYKLIRNSEPFGGIAPGTSDFSTGISEYSKQDVVKATDMVAEYRAWKERGGK